jgi:hypothetical protein
MAIWAKALADMGADEALIGHGYGMEYARAVDALSRTS